MQSLCFGKEALGLMFDDDEFDVVRLASLHVLHTLGWVLLLLCPVNQNACWSKLRRIIPI